MGVTGVVAGKFRLAVIGCQLAGRGLRLTRVLERRAHTCVRGEGAVGLVALAVGRPNGAECETSRAFDGECETSQPLAPRTYGLTAETAVRDTAAIETALTHTPTRTSPPWPQSRKP